MGNSTTFGYTATFANMETGEVFEVEKGGKYIPPERVSQMKKYAIINNQTYEGKNTEYVSTLALRGNFFSILCRGAEPLCSEVSEPVLNKLVYLATYMDKNNCLCFDGNWKTDYACEKKINSRSCVPMTKSDIQTVLNVNKKTFSFFWNKCLSVGIIIEKDSAYFLSKDMFRFCSSDGVNKKKTKMIKVFKHAVRYMYEHTDERSKKSLSHLYRLIPFLNLKYNVLCDNPFEQDPEKVHPLTAADICEKLGLERKYHGKVVKALKKLSFVDKQGDLRSVITYRWDMKNMENRYWISINPQFYSGYIKETEMAKLVDNFKIDEGNLEKV